jgi:hypothetical protein
MIMIILGILPNPSMDGQTLLTNADLLRADAVRRSSLVNPEE